MQNTSTVYLVVHISVCVHTSKHVLELRSVNVAYASAKSAGLWYNMVTLSDTTVS